MDQTNVHNQPDGLPLDAPHVWKYRHLKQPSLPPTISPVIRRKIRIRVYERTRKQKLMDALAIRRKTDHSGIEDAV